MTQRAVPFLFLRGGTSRGPYFHRRDLPDDEATLSAVLTAVMGSGNPNTIDGIGGGNEVTTKVAMLSPSDDPDADVDYFFAQVNVDRPLVDYGPTCGNILVGVGPAAIEMGLIPPAGDTTLVRIRAVNTGALVRATVQTPGGNVAYAGDTVIDGVPGSAAPVALDFLRVVGSRTGALFPSGAPQETIDGVAVTLIDVAMPMMLARAADFGLNGDETAAALDENRDLFARMEAVRLEAGRRMGFGDVSEKVVPKIGLLSPPRGEGHITARYFMPWRCHPTLAVTGSQAIAASLLAPGTIAEGLSRPVAAAPATVAIEHPLGTLDVAVDYALTDGTLDFKSAGLTRTARLIARGEVMVPAAAWPP
ncbi:MAG: 4-oxalomesaconate tautomerase [Pseudomonadota bacterium]